MDESAATMAATSIAERLGEVRERIAQAAAGSGRDPSAVCLIAVSKTKSTEQIRAAYDAGQRDFGENYVQELTSKAAELGGLPGLRWHLIGHVQTNKARRVVEVAHMVHSVDSERVAIELGKRAAAAGRRLPVLIEVNIGEEGSKTGASRVAVRDLLQVVQAQPGLEAAGLMTVPPYELDARQTAPYFERLARLRDELGGPQQLRELSMGMSHDFEVAIAHGATMVRVGTAIFGSR